MTTDFNEIFCEAVDVIVAQRLSEIKYDTTIVCTIVDNSDAENGHYIVSNNENLKFDAYSENTEYKKNQQVYVLIPQGDYSAKKQITGKYDTSKISDEDQNQTDVIEVIEPIEKIILVDSIYKNEAEFGIEANGSVTSLKISEITGLNIDLSQYDSLYIKADFKAVTSDSSSLIESGNYGVKVEIATQSTDGTEFLYTAFLDCQKDMNGSIYNFKIPSTQNQTYNLSLLNPVKSVVISLYQNGNFQTATGDDYNSSGDNDIFVSNLEVGYGFNIVNVDDNIVKIVSPSNSLYKNDSDLEKIFNLFWYNKSKDNKYLGFSDGEFTNQTNAMNPKNDQEKPQYWINWYRYNNDGTWNLCNINLSSNIEMSLTKEVKLTCNQDLKESSFKAIVYCDGASYTSNSITFINEDLVNEAGPGYLYLDFTLNNGSNSQDAYPSYGANNVLINSSDKYRDRQLYFTYESSIGASLNDDILVGSTVYWYIPTVGTMLEAGSSLTKSIDDGGEGFTLISSENGYDCYSKTFTTSILPQSNNTFKYRIKELYDISAINNTIKFKVVDTNGNEYLAQKSFTFSTQGMYGTDYTLLIYEQNGRPAYTNNDSSYALNAVLYNADSIIVSDANITLDYDLINISSLNEIKYNIATAVAENVPWRTNNLSLRSEYPIAWSNSKDYYYQGPTSITYDSTGSNPKYFAGELKLFDNENKDIKARWSIAYCQKSSTPVNGKYEYKYISDINNINITHLPFITQNEGLYYLKAPKVFVDDDRIKICLIAQDDNLKLLWVQPIIIHQYYYDTSLLNDWDGDLVISTADDGTSYILATAIGAGTKNNADNTFNGVIMGDIGTVSDDTDPVVESGIFGYDKGAQAFAFKNDGTAFIGKEGSGRIEFNGNYGVIKSSNWGGEINSNGEITKPSESDGMAISLATGQIDAHNFKLTSENILLDSDPADGGYYFAIGDIENTGATNGFIGYSKDGKLIFRPTDFELSSAVSIGGTNLLLNSEPTDNMYTFDNTSTFSPWQIYNSYVNIETSPSKKGIFKINNDDDDDFDTYGIKQKVYLEKNKKYTFSLSLQASETSTGDNFKIILLDSNNPSSILLNQEVVFDPYEKSWQFIKTTFELVDNNTTTHEEIQVDFIMALQDDNKKEYKIWHPKLEQGTCSTAWSRAPEDYVSHAIGTTEYYQDLYDKQLNQEKIFNKLTNNGEIQGIFMGADNNMYINAAWIAGEVLASSNFIAARNPATGKPESATEGTAFYLDTGLLCAKTFDLRAGDGTLILNSNPEQSTNDYYLKVGNEQNYMRLDGEGNLQISANSLEITGSIGNDNLLLNSEPSVNNGCSDKNVHDPWKSSADTRVFIKNYENEKKSILYSQGIGNAWTGVQQGNLKLKSFTSYTFSTYFYIPSFFNNFSISNEAIVLEIQKMNEDNSASIQQITKQFSIQYDTWQNLSYKFDTDDSNNCNYIAKAYVKVNDFNVPTSINGEDTRKTIDIYDNGDYSFSGGFSDLEGYRINYYDYTPITNEDGTKLLCIRLHSVFRNGSGNNVKYIDFSYSEHCKVLFSILLDQSENYRPGYLMIANNQKTVFKATLTDEGNIEFEDITKDLYVKIWHPKLEESAYQTSWSPAKADLGPYSIRKNILKEAEVSQAFSNLRYFKDNWIPAERGSIPSWFTYNKGELIGVKGTGSINDYYFSVRYPYLHASGIEATEDQDYGIQQTIYLTKGTYKFTINVDAQATGQVIKVKLNNKLLQETICPIAGWQPILCTFKVTEDKNYSFSITSTLKSGKLQDENITSFDIRPMYLWSDGSTEFDWNKVDVGFIGFQENGNAISTSLKINTGGTASFPRSRNEDDLNRISREEVFYASRDLTISGEPRKYQYNNGTWESVLLVSGEDSFYSLDDNNKILKFVYDRGENFWSSTYENLKPKALYKIHNLSTGEIQCYICNSEKELVLLESGSSSIPEEYKVKFNIYHPKLEKVEEDSSYVSPWEAHPIDTIESLFNRVTEDGTKQGLFVKDGNVILNASYIQTGALRIKNKNKEIFNASVEDGTLKINVNDQLILNSNPDNDNDYYFRISGSDNASELSFSKDGKLNIKATSFTLVGAAQPNLLSETAPQREGIIYTLAKDEEGEWTDSIKTNTWFAYNAKTTVNSVYSSDMFPIHNSYGFRCTYGSYTSGEISKHTGWGMCQNVRLTPGETYTFSAFVTAQGRSLNNNTNSCNRQINIRAGEINENNASSTQIAIKQILFKNLGSNSTTVNWPYEYITWTFTVPSTSKGLVRISIYAPVNTSTIADIHMNTDSELNGGSQGGKFWIYYPKLEKGSEATPWIDKEIQKGSLETQFQELTQNGKIKGIYYQNNDLFINASYIKTGTINASLIKVGGNKVLITEDGMINAALIKAGSITVNSISADKITGGTLGASSNDGTIVIGSKCRIGNGLLLTSETAYIRLSGAEGNLLKITSQGIQRQGDLFHCGLTFPSEDSYCWLNQCRMGVLTQTNSNELKLGNTIVIGEPGRAITLAEYILALVNNTTININGTDYFIKG